MWKIFAVLTCGLTVAAFTWFALIVSEQAPGEVNVIDLISLVLSVPASIGVVCYAFDKDLLPSAFWPPFARVLTFWTALYLVGTAWMILSLGIANSAWSELAAMAALYAAALALAYYGWLGVWRYAARVKRHPSSS
ncbi:hypothetical protein [Ensifer adhaerens]|uniref:hypothetical protein n=1 Tax=Ensifer adhaerens TaxID=106592 RepID=UPI000CF177F1|nr:hypothetical protein [Ensifer adhaerens]